MFERGQDVGNLVDPLLSFVIGGFVFHGDNATFERVKDFASRLVYK